MKYLVLTTITLLSALVGVLAFSITADYLAGVARAAGWLQGGRP